jgi:hypothetical protein
MQAKSFVLSEFFVPLGRDELYGRTYQRQTLPSAAQGGS